MRPNILHSTYRPNFSSRLSRRSGREAHGETAVHHVERYLVRFLVHIDYSGALSVCCDEVSVSCSGSFARHSAAFSGLPQSS